MHSHQTGRAPDYTIAALTMLGINAFLGLFAVWAVFGFLPTVLLGVMLHHVIDRLARRRVARVPMSRPSSAEADRPEERRP